MTKQKEIENEGMWETPYRLGKQEGRTQTLNQVREMIKKNFDNEYNKELRRCLLEQLNKLGEKK